MPIFGTIRISFCIVTPFSKNKIKHDKISLIHEARAEQITFCSDLFIKHLCVELM